jgi:hypothetical protein
VQVVRKVMKTEASVARRKGVMWHINLVKILRISDKYVARAMPFPPTSDIIGAIALHIYGNKTNI